MNKIGILILGDEFKLIKRLNGFFNENGFMLHYASDPLQAYTILEENNINLVLMDYKQDGKFSPNFLKSFNLSYPELETIVIDDEKQLAAANGSKKKNPSNFFSKPVLSKDLKKLIEESHSIKKYKKLQIQLDQNFLHFSSEMRKMNLPPIIGVSPAIKTIISLILLVAKSEDTSVIITGESGTGKELVARGIHAMSLRNKGPFNAVNCSAVPDSLFESEFFGFRKGAFTGAFEKSMGWFELANNGTLFLDEVTELPLIMQSKLLRVLDDKSIYKVGSREEIRLNLRVISATNKDIHQLLDQNTLRLDLFHRLNSFHIHIPPLRERKDDIPVLLNYYAQEFSRRQNKPEKPLDDQVIEKLMHYHFPGNIREMKNMVERAVITSDDPVLRLRDFNISTNKKPSEIANPLLKTLNLHEVERKTISDALIKTSFNVSRAAAMLSISRQRLYRKMEKFRIQNKTVPVQNN
jgi:DNA-binding NtrC family response regulator